jgi:hypothetical protein
MSKSRNFFRSALDALIMARTRQAERQLASYRNTVDTYAQHSDNR